MIKKNEGKLTLFFLLSDEAKIAAHQKKEKKRLENDF
jgi:hypothetical protein